MNLDLEFMLHFPESSRSRWDRWHLLGQPRAPIWWRFRSTRPRRIVPFRPGATWWTRASRVSTSPGKSASEYCVSRTGTSYFSLDRAGVVGERRSCCWIKDLFAPPFQKCWFFLSLMSLLINEIACTWWNLWKVNSTNYLTWCPWLQRDCICNYSLIINFLSRLRFRAET